MEEVFEAADLDEGTLQAAQLTASRSLLDPARRGNRQDLLVSSLIAVLGTRGELTADRLFDAVRRMWRTNAIANAVLEHALTDARSAGLISQQTDLDGVERFKVAEAATSESEQDKNYVEHLLASFSSEIAERLAEYADAERLLKKVERIANLVVTAIARASEGSYAVESPGASSWARPVHVAPEKITSFSKGLQPRSVREPVEQLALDALDPSDTFGNEIVHLVVVGNLLHGLAAQRGTEEHSSLANMRVLLDTSTLVGLVHPGADPGHKLVDSLIGLSLQCGAKVIVAQHTLDEWERVWAAAEAQEKAQRSRAESGMSPRLTRFVGNPFLAAYLAYRHAGGQHSWIRWQEGRRTIASHLEALGVEIQEHTTESQSDADCYESVRLRLLELSDDPEIRASRTKAGADADASSAAMIARWRRDHGDGTALFLARETLTGRAFADVFGDTEPLVGSPDAWLLYVSNILGDDPASAIEIADLIADLAVRDTILGMATSHSLEEALDIADVLGQDDAPTAREMRDLDDRTLFDELDDLQKEAAQDVRVRASAVLQRRATRSNQRAAHREAIQSAELEAVRLEAQKQLDRETRRADRLSTEANAFQQRAEGAESDSEALGEENIRLKRTVYAVATTAVAVLLLVFLASWGFVGLRGGALAFGVVALGVFYAHHWVTTPTEPTKRLWFGLSAQVLLELLLALVL